MARRVSPPLLAFPLAGERVALHLHDPQTLSGTLTRLDGGARAGAFQLHVDAHQLVIWCLEVEPAARGNGLGSEAAALLRDAAARAGFRAVRARSHPDLGLSVYFWMRMGLHPLLGPGPEGGIWFERALAPADGHPSGR
jgi:GNAT superfamily N-acetyltransferase